jgi:hypothetical protein
VTIRGVIGAAINRGTTVRISKGTVTASSSIVVSAAGGITCGGGGCVSGVVSR